MEYPRNYFPPEVVRHAVRLKQSLGLSFRSTSDLLQARGLKVSHEAVRAWVSDAPAGGRLPLLGSGKAWRPELRLVSFRRKDWYLWVAVDGRGEVGEIFLQSLRDEAEALERLTAGLAQQRRLAADL